MEQPTYTTKRAAIIGGQRDAVKRGIKDPLCQVHFKVMPHPVQTHLFVWEAIDLTPAPKVPASPIAQVAAAIEQKERTTVTNTTQAEGAPSAAVAAIFGDTKISKNRLPAVELLVARQGEYVPLTELVESVYGAGSYATSRGKFMLVMKGLQKDTIGKHKVSATIKQKKEGRNIAYGLFPKGH